MKSAQDNNAINQSGEATGIVGLVNLNFSMSGIVAARLSFPLSCSNENSAVLNQNVADLDRRIVRHPCFNFRPPMQI